MENVIHTLLACGIFVAIGIYLIFKIDEMLDK